MDGSEQECQLDKSGAEATLTRNGDQAATIAQLVGPLLHTCLGMLPLSAVEDICYRRLCLSSFAILFFADMQGRINDNRTITYSASAESLIIARRQE